jgi:hypothetical protein
MQRTKVAVYPSNGGKRQRVDEAEPSAGTIAPPSSPVTVDPAPPSSPTAVIGSRADSLFAKDYVPGDAPGGGGAGKAPACVVDKPPVDSVTVCTTVEVTVPAGYKSGDSFHVRTPDGTVKVVLPPGVASGETIRVRVRVPPKPTPKPLPPPPEALTAAAKEAAKAAAWAEYADKMPSTGTLGVAANEEVAAFAMARETIEVEPANALLYNDMQTLLQKAIVNLKKRLRGPNRVADDAPKAFELWVLTEKLWQVSRLFDDTPDLEYRYEPPSVLQAIGASAADGVYQGGEQVLSPAQALGLAASAEQAEQLE